MSEWVAHFGDAWFRLEEQSSGELDAYPTLTDAAIVVSDFGAQALSGEMELEGNAAHAPVLISRRLMSQGATDGETRVLIHAVEKVASTYQVIYTAIDISQWQRLMEWTRARPRVCLIVPVMTVLWKHVRPAQAVVARNGRHLSFLARADKHLIHCSTTSFSESPVDMAIAARALGERVRAELSKVSSLPQRYTASWHTVLAHSGERESEVDSAQDAAAVTAFSDACALAIEVAPSQPLGAASAARSSLPGLLRAGNFLNSVNPLSQRMSWALEHWVRLWCGAMVVMALLCTLYSGVLVGRARQIDTVSERRQGQARAIQAQVVQMRSHTAVPAGYDAWSQQILAQAAAQRKFDVAHIVGTVGAAAQVSGLSILRIYTTTPASMKNRAVPEGRALRDTPRLVVVDGALPAQGDGAQVDRLARFVEALRVKGWDAAPAETAAGHVDGNLLAKVFSYRLTPLGADGQGKK
ncbi:hypothetical protein H0X90_31095 [Burkholderia sp. 9775_39]|uniref:hypothetical protein n=1 Tax=unclassified Burkholderia TaxID=2613784 RepID=UPI0018C3C440|nr:MULTISPECIES: hypothetical protein [unclassified Burkholderia]MBG0881255.1 hypothetical protein [Burkholderia sp. 9775_39]MBG0887668.1 hypothetical protein [Burkholderia sp. 9773_38]